MDQPIISAIIIDDEPDAINLLEMYLRQFPAIQVIGKECQAITGLKLVREKLPELVFLDIDMPDMNGLRVANSIQSENPYSEIVFTTAHQQYAYDALDIEPLDFLTKPFCIDDLEIVIKKYQAKVEKERQEKKLDIVIQSQDNSPRIKFPTTNGILIVDIKSVVILKSSLNNCDVYLDDGTVETITRNLYKVVKLLNSSALFQTNRSTYVNMNYLQRIDKKNSKCILSYNNTVSEVPIARPNLLCFEKMDNFPNITDKKTE
jgi:two-component system LytT family response regulator